MLPQYRPLPLQFDFGGSGQVRSAAICIATNPGRYTILMNG